MSINDPHAAFVECPVDEHEIVGRSIPDGHHMKVQSSGQAVNDQRCNRERDDSGTRLTASRKPGAVSGGRRPSPGRVAYFPGLGSSSEREA